MFYWGSHRGLAPGCSGTAGPALPEVSGLGPLKALGLRPQGGPWDPNYRAYRPKGVSFWLDEAPWLHMAPWDLVGRIYIPKFLHWFCEPSKSHPEASKRCEEKCVVGFFNFAFLFHRGRLIDGRC